VTNDILYSAPALYTVRESR